MDLENALETAGQLRDALAAEVESARAERQLLRTLDAERLFARAAERAAFLARTSQLERALGASLARATSSIGLGELTLERLRKAAPVAGAAIADLLSEIRALAAALQEIDALNVQLARRALACVRGYVDALHPAPRAYDRRGAHAGAPAVALVTSKG